MDSPRIIRKFSITATLEAMQQGQVLEVSQRTCQPEIVYNAAKRLEKMGRGRYEVHRSAGDSTIIKLGV